MEKYSAIICELFGADYHVTDYLIHCVILASQTCFLCDWNSRQPESSAAASLTRDFFSPDPRLRHSSQKCQRTINQTPHYCAAKRSILQLIICHDVSLVNLCIRGLLHLFFRLLLCFLPSPPHLLPFFSPLLFLLLCLSLFFEFHCAYLIFGFQLKSGEVEFAYINTNSAVPHF